MRLLCRRSRAVGGYVRHGRALVGVWRALPGNAPERSRNDRRFVADGEMIRTNVRIWGIVIHSEYRVHLLQALAMTA